MSVTPVPAATLSLGLLGLGLSFAMLSWLLTGLNIVFTVHLRRRAGMHFGDMPVLVWTLYLSGIQLILAAIGISIALLILAMFYTTGDAFFGPGSDPWRKLFAFLSSLVLLPAVGVMTDVISGLSRKDISAPRVVLGSLISLLSLAVITGGMMLFGHSRETGAVLIFTIIRLMAVIPLALITYSWLSTLHRGAVANTAATTWMLIFCLQAGLTGVMGLVLANPVLGVQLGGSMFASVQHDFLIWGVVVGGLMAGLHLWWPQVTGAEPGSTMARRSACLYVIGLNLALIPRLSPELAGAGQDLMFINAALTIPGIVSAVGWAMTLIALAISFGNLFAAKRSGPMSGSVTT
jgi:cytochrome c oxidase subunit 1